MLWWTTRPWPQFWGGSGGSWIGARFFLCGKDFSVKNDSRGLKLNEIRTKKHLNLFNGSAGGSLIFPKSFSWLGRERFVDFS